MARWKVTPGTVGNTMTGGVDYGAIGEQTTWEIKQDISEVKKEIQRDRDMLATGRHNKMGFRKMATIPDIVAIQIMENHQLNVHDQTFMSDPNNLKKLRKILMTEYPDLLIST